MRNGRWILVVDDDDSIRELMTIILESQGYEVETAEDGAEALERVRRGSPPSLVLLDLMMPGMDGIAFLRELRSDDDLSGVPVVVISGDQRATHRLGRMDVQDCMMKPIELDDLLQTVPRFTA
jgi:CheY-like chemotaxis protein